MMKVLWNTFKYVTSFFLLVGLVFSSGVFSVLLYGKIKGKEWAISYKYADAAPLSPPAAPLTVRAVPETSQEPTDSPASDEKKASVLLEAPVYRQHPELPRGCEITSLAMLLNYGGIKKSKMDLLPDLPKDTTPLKRGADGSIEFWGNPNVGFVGEITTAKGPGYGIYHGALYQVLQKYMPNGIDLTRSSFSKLEEQLSGGIPVVVWTTIDFKAPDTWSVWDTPTGPIQISFMEHAVLLVGYDEENVYVNDPWTGKSKVKVNKAQFIQSWEAMGRQALSYT